MALRYEPITNLEGLQFLRHCYRYVTEEWQRCPREALPDQGFELHFRRFSTLKLNGWLISQPWELELGSELQSASGLRHEIDLVARHSEALAIVEAKNRPGMPPGKCDVVVFFAKFLDYLAFNPRLLLSEVCPVFLSSSTFEEGALAACLGLGIHPVAPGLRPLPLLADNLQRIGHEFERGLVPTSDNRERWDDSCAMVNRLVLGLGNTWVPARCGYVSDERINLRPVGGIDTIELGRVLRQANGDCAVVLDAVRLQKTSA